MRASCDIHTGNFQVTDFPAFSLSTRMYLYAVVISQCSNMYEFAVEAADTHLHGSPNGNGRKRGFALQLDNENNREYSKKYATDLHS
jgi:hypothetical protein